MKDYLQIYVLRHLIYLEKNLISWRAGEKLLVKKTINAAQS